MVCNCFMNIHRIKTCILPIHLTNCENTMNAVSGTDVELLTGEEKFSKTLNTPKSSSNNTKLSYVSTKVRDFCF